MLWAYSLDSRVHSRRHITSHRLCKKHISKTQQSMRAYKSTLKRGHHVRLSSNVVIEVIQNTSITNLLNNPNFYQSQDDFLKMSLFII